MPLSRRTGPEILDVEVDPSYGTRPPNAASIYQLLSLEQQQIETERNLHRFGRLRSSGAIDRKEDVVNRRGIEIGCGSDAALIEECEPWCECLNGPRDAIATLAAQFDQIVRRGNGDEKVAAV